MTFSAKRLPSITIPFAVVMLVLLSSCDASSLGGQTQNLRFEHGGLERSVEVFIPGTVTDSPNVPLVIAFHGAGGSGPLFREQSRLDEQANEDDFAVAYPTATGANWAEGCDCVRPDLDGVDDVGFAAAIIDEVEKVMEVDRRNVYAVGYSQGAVFLHHLACESGDTFAGFASVAGMMSVPVSESCSRTAPAHMMMVNGSDDTVLPFDGQDAGSQSLLSAVDTMLRWRDEAGCVGGAVRTTERVGTARADVRRYGTCENGAQVHLYELLDHGHEWPAPDVAVEAEISSFFGLRRDDF